VTVSDVFGALTGGGCPILRGTLIQPMETVLNQTTFMTQALSG